MGTRTYEQSLTFFKHKTESRGDNRELYKTPYVVIHDIVDSLLEEYPSLRDKHWIDPCAGDGRWEHVIVNEFGLECKSYDIQPLAKNVIQEDFLTSVHSGDDLFFIGNPPFSLLKRFINRALSMAESCYFLGGSQLITGSLSDKVALLHRFYGAEGNQKDNRSKVNFIDTNGKKVPVWCCGALFDGGGHPKMERVSVQRDGYDFATSPKCFCYEDLRVISLRGD